MPAQHQPWCSSHPFFDLSVPLSSCGQFENFRKQDGSTWSRRTHSPEVGALQRVQLGCCGLQGSVDRLAALWSRTEHLVTFLLDIDMVMGQILISRCRRKNYWVTGPVEAPLPSDGSFPSAPASQPRRCCPHYWPTWDRRSGNWRGEKMQKKNRTHPLDQPLSSLMCSLVQPCHRAILNIVF